MICRYHPFFFSCGCRYSGCRIGIGGFRDRALAGIAVLQNEDSRIWRSTFRCRRYRLRQLRQRGMIRRRRRFRVLRSTSVGCMKSFDLSCFLSQRCESTRGSCGAQALLSEKWMFVYLYDRETLRGLSLEEFANKITSLCPAV